ncbi:MAG: hypothetical protein KDA99_08945 [Planctomycetales bacterium]|nr:hypothetical protein [Planctomycetales bacterium]
MPSRVCSRSWLVPLSFATTLTLVYSTSCYADDPTTTDFPSDAPSVTAGYADYSRTVQRLQTLGESQWGQLDAISRTLQGRNVYVLTVGRGRPADKPGILVVGSIDPGDLVGNEIALSCAEHLVAECEEGAEIKDVLERVTYYFIPLPSPDATEKNFSQSTTTSPAIGNARKTDDDRDGSVGEDPPDDLNGDGIITMMRVTTLAGRFMPHPADPRVLIEAAPEKNERGSYDLYVEGIDNDHDEQFNEDSAGGVSFNVNFTYKYPAYQPHAGPHAVSEIETRAIADFLFDHPNISLVFCCCQQDNLAHAWKAKPDGDGDRVNAAVKESDNKYLEWLAKEYQKLVPMADAPETADMAGSFAAWSYFHYGRWTLATSGWWIPRDVDVESGGGPSDGAKATDAGTSNGESASDRPATEASTDNGTKREPNDAKPKENHVMDEKRGEAEIRALRWLAAKNVDGFVDWARIDHPDFPDRVVEVGGFKPWVRTTPPRAELAKTLDANWQFLRTLPEHLPQLHIDVIRIEDLGGGIFELRADVINQGYLPTSSKMGVESRNTYPLQYELTLPAGAEFLRGSRRVLAAEPISGNGGRQEKTWLIRLPPSTAMEGKLRVFAPHVGDVEKVFPAVKGT